MGGIVEEGGEGVAGAPGPETLLAHLLDSVWGEADT